MASDNSLAGDSKGQSCLFSLHHAPIDSQCSSNCFISRMYYLRVVRHRQMIWQETHTVYLLCLRQDARPFISFCSPNTNQEKKNSPRIIHPPRKLIYTSIRKTNTESIRARYKIQAQTWVHCLLSLLYITLHACPQIISFWFWHMCTVGLYLSAPGSTGQASIQL